MYWNKYVVGYLEDRINSLANSIQSLQHREEQDDLSLEVSKDLLILNGEYLRTLKQIKTKWT